METRIDALNPAVSAQADHFIPAMRDDQTVKLTTQQLADFIIAILTDSAPATLDTLNELAAALGDDPNFAATTATALANRLRFDAGQTLTAAQQAQGQSNLGVFSLVPDFVQGLTLSNSTANANNGIDLAVGQAKGNLRLVVSSAVIGKRLDQVWTAGGTAATPLGGLDTGSKASSTAYHVHAIANNTTGAFDALLSLSATAPTVPAGWTRVQRLCCIRTDASGNILPVVQTGNYMALTSYIQDRIGVLTTGSASLLPLSVATGVKVAAKYSVEVFDENLGVVLMSDPAIEDQAPTTNSLGSVSNSVNSGRGFGEFTTTTDTSAQIRIRGVESMGATISEFVVFTQGWDDFTVPRIG